MNESETSLEKTRLTILYEEKRLFRIELEERLLELEDRALTNNMEPGSVAHLQPLEDVSREELRVAKERERAALSAYLSVMKQTPDNP